MKTIVKNTYIGLIFKLLLFGGILFLMDLLIGKTLTYFYFKQQSGLQFCSTYSIEKTTAEVLVFGASRANHHYVPEIIENKIKMSYYNVGRDGISIFYQYAVLKGILKRYIPKIIILDFVIDEFEYNKDSYERLSTLLPYYKTHPEFQSIIQLKSPFEKVKLLSNIYPYNSSIFTIAIGNLEVNKKRNSDNKGFIPLSKKWEEPLKTIYYNNKVSLDSNKIKIYKLFIEECIRLNIKVYIIISPYYAKFNEERQSKVLGKEIANNFKVPFLDYSNDSLFLANPKYFQDFSHLNIVGAQVFTNSLIDNIF